MDRFRRWLCVPKYYLGTVLGNIDLGCCEVVVVLLTISI